VLDEAPKRETILVVDDEPDTVALCERLFRDEHDLITAHSGEAALEHVVGKQISAALVDQRMPGKNGIEVLIALAESHPDTARIVMTAYTQLESIVQLINQGRIHAFVVKPWNNFELRQTVTHELQLYRARKELSALHSRVDREHRDMLALLTSLDPEFEVPTGNTELKSWKRRLTTQIGREVEGLFLRRLLDQTRGSVARAARRAKINRTFLYRMLKRHGLT
jgi:DNA-binding NtrC family response regulator